MPIKQDRNAELQEIMLPYFQPRDEPNFSWKSAVSAFMGVPALRAAWPISCIGHQAADQVRDVSGNGNHLTSNNTPLFSQYSLRSYVRVNGTTQYLSRADTGAGDWAGIRGNEAYIASTWQGLTLGGWFYFDNAAGASLEYLMAKKSAAGAANTAYILYRDTAGSGGAAKFLTSDGVNTNTVGTSSAIDALKWQFIVGRFDPGVGNDIFWNPSTPTDFQTNANALPALIQDIAAPLTVGATGVPDAYFDGVISIIFLSAMYLSNTMIWQLFQQSRRIFRTDN